MKPSRARTQLPIAAYTVIAVAAVALLVLADNGALRLAMALMLISAALGIALGLCQARHSR